MKKLLTINFFFLLAAFPLYSFAASSTPSIVISTNPETVVQKVPFKLTIDVEIHSDEQPQIKLPLLDEFRILNQSESHPMSFSFSWGSGTASTSIHKKQSIYTFLLVADNPGKHVLKPVIVQVGKQKYRSDSYTIDVKPSSSGTATSNSQPGGNVIPDAIAQGANLSGNISSDDDFFVRTEVSKQNAVTGEMVVMTLAFYTAWHFSDVSILKEPGTDGFWVENLLPGQRRLSRQPVEIEGKRFDRVVLQKLALFPVKPGTLSIVPAVVEIEVGRGGFFSNRKVVKRVAMPVEIEVTVPPRKDMPPEFENPNVGNFSLSINASEKKVKVGQPVTLEIAVEGRGNIRNLILPELLEVEGFKVYKPEIQSDVETTANGVMGKKTNKYLMVALKSGNFEVPPVVLHYFDPETGSYKISRSRKIPLEILPGKSQVTSTVSDADKPAKKKSGIIVLNNKLRSLITDANLKTPGDILIQKTWFQVLVILFPVLYFSILIFSFAKKISSAGGKKQLAKKADSIAIKELNSLSAKTDSMDTNEFFGRLQKIFLSFLGNHLGENVTGDTMTCLQEKLVNNQVNKDVAAAIIQEIEACEFARFASSAANEEEKKKTLVAIKKIITSSDFFYVSGKRNNV